MYIYIYDTAASYIYSCRRLPSAARRPRPARPPAENIVKTNSRMYMFNIYS